MTVDFSINTLNSQQHAPNTHATGQNLKGTFMGQAVAVSTPFSLLANAAEELSFFVDTTDDFELEERKEKENMRKSSKELREIYMEMMFQVNEKEGMNNLRASLYQSMNKNSPLDQARKYFSNPSDIWAALSEILDDMESDTNAPKQVMADIEAALIELEDAHRKEIVAGLHGVAKSSDFTDLANSANLRDFYVNTVCDYQDTMAVFEHIQVQYGSIGFEKAMDFLFSAISSDIGSDIPSMEKVHLENVHNNLGKVRLLQSTHVLCDILLQRWASVHEQKHCPLTPTELLHDMISLGKERFLGNMHINNIMDKAKPQDIELQVLFLQELLNTSRKIPPLVYNGEQEYIKVIDAIQSTLDDAITREDEYLASLDN